MTAILEHTKKLYRLDMRACVLHLGYYSSTYCIIVMSGDISNKIKATECKVMSLDSDSCNSKVKVIWELAVHWIFRQHLNF